MAQPRRKPAQNQQISLFAPLELLPGRVRDGLELVVSARVDRVLFAGASRGRMELMATLEDGLQAKIVGRGDPVSPGEDVDAKGRWVPDPKYGRRFEADSISTRFPETAEGIVRYLSGGAVKGVGRAAAETLHRHFGDRLPQVVRLPTELIAAGLSEEKAAALAAHWELRTRHGRLLSVLFSHGIGELTAQKIIRRYGDKAPSVVTAYPYRLADDIKGIGFKKADTIALSQNLPKDSPDRIRAGLKACAQAAGRDGDSCQPRDKLAIEASDLLTLPERDVRAQEEAMLRAGELVADRIGGREVVYAAEMHACETWLADDIFARIEPTPVGEATDRLIDACAEHVHRGQEHFKGLHEGQHLAVRTAIENRFSIVTGGPGTGKTATLKTVIACLQAIQPNIRITCAAPTGAAAQRITESTGHPASTVHVALGARGDGFRYGKQEKLETDVFVIDESSMLDVWLTRSILEALDHRVRILMIGDSNQLPSVGPGNVLCDLIDSGAVPVARLTKVYRTGAGSEIALAAEAINQGQVPKIFKPSRSSDNWTVLVDEPGQAVDKLLALATKVLPDLGYDPVMDFQAITPGHQHETGTANLNTVLQEALNPADGAKAELEVKGRLFRTGDKVVHTINDADRGVFNGNIGRIIGISTTARPRMFVEYRDREIEYDRSQMDALAQAWAITVHKSQGSEAKVVAPMLTAQHYILLKRNLYYTALTRARLLCCTIGQYRALRRAVKTEGSRRLTGLAQRLAAKSFAASRKDSVIAF